MCQALRAFLWLLSHHMRFYFPGKIHKIQRSLYQIQKKPDRLHAVENEKQFMFSYCCFFDDSVILISLEGSYLLQTVGNCIF